MPTEALRRTVLGLLVLLPVLTGGRLEAQENLAGTWTVAAAVLEHDGGDEALAAAARLIPRLILDELTAVRIHVYSDSDRAALDRRAQEIRIAEIRAELAESHRRRGELFFDPNADPAVLAELDASIAESTRVLEAELAAEPAPRDWPASAPVDIVAGEDGSRLVNPGALSPDILRRERGWDMLVSGRLARVGDYFGIRLELLGAAGSVILWEGAGDETEIARIAREASRAARTPILGRPWAALTITAEPSDAVISVNGEAVGVGFWSDPDREPGEAVVEVTAHGRAPRVERIILGPGDDRSLAIELERAEPASVLVRSEPIGAAVRLGTLPLGRTPLLVEIPDRTVPLSFELEGFRRRTVPLAPDTGRLTVPLEAAVADPAAELARTRKELHNAIAMFSASLAPTIVLLGVNRNYFFKASNASFPSAEYDDAARAYDITYGLMWGGVALNAGFLTLVLWRLHRYLDAAEGLSD